jgi:N-acetylmuramoyl-L-alanine amidase
MNRVHSSIAALLIAFGLLWANGFDVGASGRNASALAAAPAPPALHGVSQSDPRVPEQLMSQLNIALARLAHELGAALLSVQFDGRIMTIDLTDPAFGDRSDAALQRLMDAIGLEVNRVFEAAGLAESRSFEYRLLMNGSPLFEPRPAYKIAPILSVVGKRLVLSPGHGYYETTTGGWSLQRGFWWGIVEDFVNLELVAELNGLLDGSGADRRPTRQLSKYAGNHSSGHDWWQMDASEYVRSLGVPYSVWNAGFNGVDRDIVARPEYGNYVGADLMISIHNNGGGGCGTETYYDTGNGYQDVSHALADTVHGKLIERLRSQWDGSWCNRGVKGVNGNYGENRRFHGAAILLELAFMDNQSNNAAVQNAAFRTIAMVAIRDALIGGAGSCSYTVGQGVSGSELAAFQDAHVAAGGEAALGCPTAAVARDGFSSFNGTVGHYQTFERGSIQYHTNNSHAREAYAIVDPVRAKWNSFGFNCDHPLGYPIGELSASGSASTGTLRRYQPFEGGVLEWHVSGPRIGQVFEVHGAIYRKYVVVGGIGWWGGLPTSDEKDSPSSASGATGRVSDFERGHIWWKTGASEAFATQGDIDARYVSQNGPSSCLGFPTSDEFANSSGRAQNNFENGFITTLDGQNYQVFCGGSVTRVIGLSGNLAFGSVTVGTTATRTLTISNSGNATLTVSGITYPSGFSGAWSGTIGPGGSQNVTVRFAPTSVTSYGGTVIVNGDQTSGTNTIAASGTGTTAPTRIISLSGNLAFGSVTVGTTATRTLTISNGGNATLTVSGISYPSGFSGAWSGTIGPGGSQNVTVTFAPMAAISYGGDITVDGDQTSGENRLATSGRGATEPADFNGDGDPDMVWRDRVTGEVIFWLMNGTALGSEVRTSGPADRNWTIAAIADFNGDAKPDLVWRNVLTGENQIWFMNGTSHTSSATLPAVGDVTWEIGAAADFNLDGKPDLLWRNTATGEDIVWYMNGASYAGYVRLPTVGDTNWTVAAADDFNGDGGPDLLWRNQATGENLVWYLNGAAYAGYAWLATEPDVHWVIAGTADYNGDGSPDIVWRNVVTGENKVTYMNGATATGSDPLPGMTNPDWDLLGPAGTVKPAASDFNADGYVDILWRNVSTGENRLWYMNGATRVSEGTVDTEPDLNWRSVAVADFNGDGLPDIVWRNVVTGENKIWLMTGATHSGDMSLPTIADTNWRIVGAADFNRDGHPDLVWRNQSTGANVIWFLVNGVYAGWTAPPTIPDTNWQIVGVGDFNGDGWPDLFWRNQATGVNIAWFMVNGAYAGWAAPPTIVDTTWQIVGVADFNGDGKADLLWRNQTDGRNLVWYLNNGVYLGFDWLPTLDVAWRTGPGQ